MLTLGPTKRGAPFCVIDVVAIFYVTAALGFLTVGVLDHRAMHFFQAAAMFGLFILYRKRRMTAGANKT